MPVVDAQALIEDRVQAIREYHDRTGIERAELDVSGGVDSAVMLGLLALALGPENVTAVYSSINSSPESLERARLVADTFGVRLVEVDLTSLYENLVDTMLESLAQAGYDTEQVDYLIESDPTVLGSLRSCLRAPVGRGFNRLTGGGIRHGTGNEDEDRIVRFYQKGGDGEVDTNPIAMLSKGEVYQLACALGVPHKIINALPTPDLWASGERHNDEDEYSDWLAFNPPPGLSWYSYVDPESGRYTNVGLLERVARFVDLTLPGERIPVKAVLFAGEGVPDYLVNFAVTSDLFEGLTRDEIRGLLRAMKRAERITRHKYNPNCPTLGSRADLVEKGILTNNLPV